MTPSEDRSRDERHLHWLALRTSGYSSGEIADAYGVRCEHVRTVTLRIKCDDEAHDPQALGAYRFLGCGDRSVRQ